MNWIIEFDSDVEKDLIKLSHAAQKRIIEYLKDKIIPAENPRVFGKPLSGDRSGLWRYRVGDYRIIGAVDISDLDVPRLVRGIQFDLSLCNSVVY